MGGESAGHWVVAKGTCLTPQMYQTNAMCIRHGPALALLLISPHRLISLYSRIKDRTQPMTIPTIAIIIAMTIARE